MKCGLKNGMKRKNVSISVRLKFISYAEAKPLIQTISCQMLYFHMWNKNVYYSPVK